MAIDQLPERERLLIKLFYYDGLAYKQIAEVMRIPANSISPLLTRAKDRIRDFYNKKKPEIQ
jgi:RNA polymerase sigma factor (sigma-70 family)